MGTHIDYSTCRECGAETVVIHDTRYQSTEEHCSNEDCRFYDIETGLLPQDAIGITGSGFHAKKDWEEEIKSFYFYDE